MERKKLLIAGGLIGFIICLFISAFLFVSFGSILVSEIVEPSEYNDNVSFNNSTPELMAASIARLNFGVYFNEVTVRYVYLTPDGKYWKVDTYTDGKDPHSQVTIDAKTLMSKRNDDNGEGWRSLEELKASYIAEIQSNYPLGKPKKITMDGKEIWKVLVYNYDEDGSVSDYVYVDLATGKSKNTLDEFNKAAGTEGWLTLKEVDVVINSGNCDLNYLVNLDQTLFRDVLRDLYSE